MDKTKLFIQKAKEIHGNKYDYSKVDYKKSTIKICIICPMHGEFLQTPSSHLAGHGCQKCALEKRILSKKLTKEQFIQKAKEVHGNKYDYSKANYINMTTKLEIVCPAHGSFFQTPLTHINSHGCKKCHKIKRMRLTKEQFIQRAKEIHGNKYDYSKADYINMSTKVKIICPIHGSFFQTPSLHLRPRGCPLCAKTKKLNIEKFIYQSQKIHGNRYDYSKVNYINNKTPVEIICPIHGSFFKRPDMHIFQKQGCPLCFQERKKKPKYSKEQFIQKAKEVHGNKYDYSKVNYTNMNTKVEIICKKHGNFWQIPSKHLNGQGCPLCKTSIMEEFIANFLKEKEINFERQKTFDNCRNILMLPFDFYLPNFNLLIEYDGEQHFNKNSWNGSTYERTIKNDRIKNNWCKENNISLLRLNYKMKKEKICKVLQKTLHI